MTAGTGVVPRASFRVPLADGRALDLGERTLVMGVLNVTPDSFADRVPFGSVADAIEAALAMERDGADLIDVGGESTRPGAEPVPEVEELARVVPVVRALVRRLRVPVSVDTYKAEVARAVLGEGASIVNDISGLGYDPTLGAVVASAGAAIVLMHTRGRSREMYREATYGEVARDVAAELAESLRTAVSAGIGLDRVIVDPGFGFAKRAEHNFELLARLDELAVLGRPILVGVSRKSFLAAASGDLPPVARDWGTAAAVTAAVLGGAHVVRVHAVGAMVQAVRVADQIRRFGRSGDRQPLTRG